ncbi:diguanylate cyclase [uncultured Thiomicrorhabdus sp.]
MKLIPKSIKNKLILSIALIHALLMTLFVFDLVQRQQEFLTQESQMAAQGIVKTLAANSIPWMLSNDLAGLEELATAQANQANINFVMLVNNHGKILAYHNNIDNQHHSKNIGKYIELPKLNPFNPQRSEHYYFNDRNAIDVAIPVWKDQSQLGWARVQLSRTNTSQSIKVITKEGLFYTAFAIILGSLLAWYMGFNLTSRIYKLIDNTRRIRQGERKIEFPTHGKDELADLARNFQSMLAQLNQNEEDLYEEKERAEITLRSIGDAVVVIDNQSIITYMNPAAEQITAWDHYLATGKPINEVMQLFNEGTKKPLENPGTRALRTAQVIGLSKNTILINRLGDTISLVDSAAPIIDRDGNIIGAIMVFRDATEEHSLQQRLSWQATHDTLTELHNRTAFETELERLIKISAENPQHNSCLVYLDLDQFKVVNDTVGHTAGDVLLRQISNMLSHLTEDFGFLSRIGGDEFAILLNDHDLEEALAFAEKLRHSINQHRFYWENKRFQVGSSIGIAQIHGNLSKALILSRADIACYLAKDKGRDRIEAYQEDDQSRQQDQNIIDWVGRIRYALDENRFLLFAQEIIIQRTNHYNALKFWFE